MTTICRVLEITASVVLIALVSTTTGRPLRAFSRQFRPTALHSLIVLAILIFAVTTDWLLSYASEPPADALKTGGVAGGSVLVMYGVWLSDRRRRTEEARQEIEVSRTELENRRVTGERFAKMVELLGDPNEHIKIGALRALTALARDNREWVEAVVEILCSLLREAKAPNGLDVDGDSPTVGAHIRITAQKMLQEILSNDDASRRATINLRGARLHGFKLRDCTVQDIILFNADLNGGTALENVTVLGEVLISKASFREFVSLRDCRIGSLTAIRTHVYRGMDLTDTRATHSQLELDLNESSLVAQRFRSHETAGWQLRKGISLDLTGAEFRVGLRLHNSDLDGTSKFNDSSLGACEFTNVAFRRLRLNCHPLVSPVFTQVWSRHADELPAGLQARPTEQPKLGYLIEVISR